MEKEIKREIVKTLYRYYLENVAVSITTKERLQRSTISGFIRNLEIDVVRSIAPDLFGEIESVYDITDPTIINSIYPQYKEAECTAQWGASKGMHYVYSKALKNYGEFLEVFASNLNASGVTDKPTRSNIRISRDYTTREPSSLVQKAKMLLDNSGQIVLQGAPGCGKTYITTELAVYLCDGTVPDDRESLKLRYKELEEEGRIGFTTFHQSLDYEEFVEGLKPEVPSGPGEEMNFVVKPGIFKRMCTTASEQMGDNVQNYVLIIDEINRANISKVFGELITLLEKSKRAGNEDQFDVILPYSGEKFSVPDNLYIIATMNTADRSLGYIDYAIRRRFSFLTLKSSKDAIRQYYLQSDNSMLDRAIDLFEKVQKLIESNITEDFESEDVMIGHSYFMAKSNEDLDINVEYKIIPLLFEYLRDGILLEGDNLKSEIKNLVSSQPSESSVEDENSAEIVIED